MKWGWKEREGERETDTDRQMDRQIYRGKDGQRSLNAISSFVCFVVIICVRVSVDFFL